MEIKQQTPKHNTWVKGEISRKIFKYFELNKNETHQNLWDTLKVVLRGKFIALNIYIKKKKDLKKI